LKENRTVELTKVQRELLVLIGKPDDGSQTHVVADGERILQELVRLGLVHRTGKESYDLTDEGERFYGELTGEEMS
jgi:hypothetical protein